MAHAFKNDVLAKQFQTVPLSGQTVSRRMVGIDNFLVDKLRTLIQNCVYFSLCLDESTDITDISQLAIFIRAVQSDFSINEELLALVPLHNTTKGVDIYTAFHAEVTKFTTFERCTCIVTDGAPAVTGTVNGLFGLLKQNSINCYTFHCIIHQEVLCAKILRLSQTMKLVTKVTNLVRGGNRSLTDRKLQAFLKEHNAEFNDLLLYTEVRWLSAAKCLQCFLALRKLLVDFVRKEA